MQDRAEAVKRKMNEHSYYSDKYFVLLQDITSKLTFGGYLVGQNSHPNRSKEFSIGKNIPPIPSAVGT
jgi:hypothetical protein